MRSMALRSKSLAVLRQFRGAGDWLWHPIQDAQHRAVCMGELGWGSHSWGSPGFAGVAGPGDLCCSLGLLGSWLGCRAPWWVRVRHHGEIPELYYGLPHLHELHRALQAVSLSLAWHGPKPAWHCSSKPGGSGAKKVSDLGIVAWTVDLRGNRRAVDIAERLNNSRITAPCPTVSTGGQDKGEVIRCQAVALMVGLGSHQGSRTHLQSPETHCTFRRPRRGTLRGPEEDSSGKHRPVLNNRWESSFEVPKDFSAGPTTNRLNRLKGDGARGEGGAPRRVAPPGSPCGGLLPRTTCAASGPSRVVRCPPAEPRNVSCSAVQGAAARPKRPGSPTALGFGQRQRRCPSRSSACPLARRACSVGLLDLGDLRHGPRPGPARARWRQLGC